MLGFGGGIFPSFTEYKTLWSAVSIFHTGRYFLIFLPEGKLRLYFLRASLLEKDEHLSKPPCLIVLNLEVMLFCGRDLFLSKKRYLPFALTALRCCIYVWPCFGARGSFERVVFFLALMVSAKLSIKSFPKKC